jgi:hypothetical protein
LEVEEMAWKVSGLSERFKTRANAKMALSDMRMGGARFGRKYKNAKVFRI